MGFALAELVEESLFVPPMSLFAPLPDGATAFEPLQARPEIMAAMSEVRVRSEFVRISGLLVLPPGKAFRTERASFFKAGTTAKPC
jgi:hypothetical protein